MSCTQSYFFLEEFKVGNDVFCPVVEDVCFGGGQNGSAKAVKEFAAKLDFQILDMFAYCGLAGIECSSSFSKAFQFVDCDKYFEVSGLDNSPLRNFWLLKDKIQRN